MGNNLTLKFSPQLFSNAYLCLYIKTICIYRPALKCIKPLKASRSYLQILTRSYHANFRFTDLIISFINEAQHELPASRNTYKAWIKSYETWARLCQVIFYFQRKRPGIWHFSQERRKENEKSLGEIYLLQVIATVRRSIRLHKKSFFHLRCFRLTCFAAADPVLNCTKSFFVGNWVKRRLGLSSQLWYRD